MRILRQIPIDQPARETGPTNFTHQYTPQRIRLRVHCNRAAFDVIIVARNTIGARAGDEQRIAHYIERERPLPAVPGWQ
ncbi:MAG: hypothetical protein ACI85K_000018 [Hyphomicrobiaceae bacterium]|jgi:hypothetical protein